MAAESQASEHRANVLIAYFFGGSIEEHNRAVVEILHRMRWDEEMPDSFEGLNWNLLIETAVDALNNLTADRVALQAIKKAGTTK